MASPPESLKTVVTYLEQTARPKLFVPMPVNLQVALMQQADMPLHFYRYLQYRIGRDYHWVSRLRLNDAELGNILHDPATTISVLYLNGAPAGFFELSNKDPEVVSLEYFGTMQEAQGLGLGRWFLSQADRSGLEPQPFEGNGEHLHAGPSGRPAALPEARLRARQPDGRNLSSAVR